MAHTMLACRLGYGFWPSAHQQGPVQCPPTTHGGRKRVSQGGGTGAAAPTPALPGACPEQAMAWTRPGIQTGKCLAPLATWLPSRQGSQQSWV